MTYKHALYCAAHFGPRLHSLSLAASHLDAVSEAGRPRLQQHRIYQSIYKVCYPAQ